MSTIAVNTITDASGGNTAQINGATPTAYNTMGRNRIINGDMRIDQRNAGTSVAFTSAAYTLDRWIGSISTGSGHTIQQSSVAPQKHDKSALITVGTGGSPATGDVNRLFQIIEGNNIADLNWGTANAQDVTLSFKVRSSVTGTFSGALYPNGAAYSYVFQYTISSANTWETKSVTIPGPTVGSWATDNTRGVYVQFDLGTGATYQTTAGSWQSGTFIAATGATKLCETSGATFYITGVQLEVGAVATEFERRPYGTELALCQRYYQKLAGSESVGIGAYTTATRVDTVVNFICEMRVPPTITTGSGGSYWYAYANGTIDYFDSWSGSGRTKYWCNLYVTSGVSASSGAACQVQTNNAGATVIADAEL